MPIIVKDITWRQTESTLTILVPLKGVHPSKVDVFTSDRYLKLSYVPFFFDALLIDSIDTERSKCTFTTEHAVFELAKSESKLWETLECDLPRKEKNELKKKCVERQFEKNQKEAEDKSIKHHELKRIAVREQISLETRQRKHVEKLKANEKNNALGNLGEWRKALESKITEIDVDEIEDKEKDEAEFEDTESEDEEMDHPGYNYRTQTRKPEQPIFPIRTSKTVTVTFSERELPTPCRESRLEEENEWLQKQAEARRSVGFDKDDLRPEEKNPQYLKYKGDEFFKQGNYLGAISAYSFGIKLSSKYADLYLGRSAAHYAVGNMNKCTQDCSEALELMKPEVPANLNERVTCIFRRGLCLFKLGWKQKAVDELKVAWRLQPNNEEVKMELSKMVQLIEDADSDSN